MRRNKSSIYVRNAEEGPACYYRIVQYAKEIDMDFQINSLMSNRMFKLNLNWNKNSTKILMQLILYILMTFRGVFFLVRDFINPPEYIIVQRTTIPRYLPKVVQLLLNATLKKSIVYWDFDDDIFVSGEICREQAEILSKNSNKIIVTNEHLKNKIKTKYRGKVILMPTTDGDFSNLDFGFTLKEKKEAFIYEIRLTWVGTSSNLIYLKEVIHHIELAAEQIYKRQKKTVVLTVVSNKPLIYEGEFLKVKNIKWTREIAKEQILRSHVGLMPLSYSEYALGKGGFKLVQYISAGIPVIASNIGYNNSIVTKKNGFLINDSENNDAWVESIIKLTRSWDKWEEYSNNARDSWEENFSYKRNLQKWTVFLNS